MKRLLFLFSVVLLAVPVFSQNTITIHQKDGRQFSFGFDDKPVITYTDTDLLLKTTKTEVQYPLALLAKFTFADSENSDTSVNPINENKAELQLQLDSYVVNITGTKPQMSVSIIGPDGKTVGTYKTDSNGSVTFSIADLPQGLYIINAEDLTCKILKK